MEYEIYEKNEEIPPLAKEITEEVWDSKALE
jgi:hypothetical protein